MEMIDPQIIRRRFERALSTYDDHAHAQHIINRKLAALAVRYRLSGLDRALEIGCGSGHFTRLLQKECRIDQWVLNDLCADCEVAVRPFFPDKTPVFLAGDAEQIAFPDTYRLIASASVFQWMKNLPAFFDKLADLLEPGGWLLFSTFGPGNLSEIRQLTGRGLSYPPGTEIRHWLSSRFRVLHQEEETIRLVFDTPEEVLRHLKYTGVTATSAGSRWSRQQQARFCLQYRQLFSTVNNQVFLTYRPLYFAALKR